MKTCPNVTNPCGMLATSILHESVTFQNIEPCPNVTNPCRMLVPSILHESVTFQNMKPCPNVTNPCRMLAPSILHELVTLQNMKPCRNVTNPCRILPPSILPELVTFHKMIDDFFEKSPIHVHYIVRKLSTWIGDFSKKLCFLNVTNSCRMLAYKKNISVTSLRSQFSYTFLAT